VGHRTSGGLEDQRGVDFILRVRESQSGMYLNFDVRSSLNLVTFCRCGNL